MEKGSFAERFESIWSALHKSSGVGVSSQHHTWLLAVLIRASPIEFASVKQQILHYMKCLLQGQYAVSHAQLQEFACFLCDHNRWQTYRTDPEAMRVFQCFIVHSLLQSIREDQAFHYRISKLLIALAEHHVDFHFDVRVRTACVLFYGAAWWDVAFDMFEGVDGITPSLYEVMVAQPNAALSAGTQHSALPESLV